MKALTVWQPWASLIVAGAKAYEFRRWPAPKALVGQRVAVHAGVRKPTRDDVQDLLYRLEHGQEAELAMDAAKALPIVRRALALPRSAIIGTAVLGEPKRASDLHLIADSDRIDHHVWGWPMLEPAPLEPLQPARGAQGFWDWTPQQDEVSP